MDSWAPEKGVPLWQNADVVKAPFTGAKMAGGRQKSRSKAGKASFCTEKQGGRFKKNSRPHSMSSRKAYSSLARNKRLGSFSLIGLRKCINQAFVLGPTSDMKRLYGCISYQGLVITNSKNFHR